LYLESQPFVNASVEALVKATGTLKAHCRL